MATFNLDPDALKKDDNMTQSSIDELVTLKAMYNCKDYDTAVYYLSPSQVHILNEILQPYVDNPENEFDSRSDAYNETVNNIVVSEALYEFEDYSDGKEKVDFVTEEFDEPVQLEKYQDKYQDIYKEEGLDATIRQIIKDNNNEEPGWIVFYKDKLFPDKTVDEIDKSLIRVEKNEINTKTEDETLQGEKTEEKIAPKRQMRR